MEKKNNEIQVLKKQVYSYLQKSTLAPTNKFDATPLEQKLSILQFTPKWAVKSRAVGKGKDGKNVYAPYVNIGYVEKALNFLSNFNWGSEKISSEFIEGKTGDGKAKYEAMVDYKFYLYLGRVKIEKSITGTAMTYQNPATSKFEVLKNARANAVKLFAREFGIGADKDDEYQKVVYGDRLESQKEDWEALEEAKNKEADLKSKYNTNANI